jgi:hypothetical protein
MGTPAARQRLIAAGFPAITLLFQFGDLSPDGRLSFGCQRLNSLDQAGPVGNGYSGRNSAEHKTDSEFHVFLLFAGWYY